MLRASILVMCLVSGCVAADDAPTATIEVHTTSSPSVQFTGPVRAGSEIATAEQLSTGPDLCVQAALLPDTDACSLICDPAAMADFLVSEGMPTGACYQLRCSLPGVENIVGVGVCLAP